MKWLRRTDPFASPVPLDPSLKSFNGRVAALRQGGHDAGYLYLKTDVVKSGGRWFHRMPDDPPREVLESNLVTLKEGRFEDYIQGTYDEDEACRELLTNRFQLHSVWYELVWLSSEDAEAILSRFFRASASEGLQPW